MKFLLVDDEPEILEVLELLIASEYQVELIKAENGQVAIDLLETGSRFDLVICDLKMPRKNGVEVYLKLRELGETPFILLTADDSEFVEKIKNPTYFGNTEKPFDASHLFESIERILKVKDLPKQKMEYIPVSLETLWHTQNPGVSIYIRLNDNQFIKVINEDGYFDDNELQRFKKKNLDYLFIEALDYKTFVRQFNKNVFSQQAWNNAPVDESLNKLNASWQLVVEGSRQFGWSESIVEAVKLNVARTISLLEAEPRFEKHLKKILSKDSKNTLIPHCYWNLIISTQIVRELKWDSKLTIQKLTFASLLHDIELNESLFSLKSQLLRDEQLHARIFEQAHYHLLNHPQRAAELVHGWTACPADVDRIIIQHHERFDGGGFPKRLNFQNIFPLAAVFILAEEMVYRRLSHPSESLVSYFDTLRANFSRGDLKPIFEAACQVAKDIDATKV